jgi:hypothetical protein
MSDMGQVPRGRRGSRISDESYRNLRPPLTRVKDNERTQRYRDEGQRLVNMDAPVTFKTIQHLIRRIC